MKHIKIILLILLAQYQIGIAQEVDQISKLDSSTVYGVDNLDVKPFFPGGQKDFEHFLRKNFKTANNEKMPNLTGLRISFIVDRNGNFTNIHGLDEMNPLARARFMDVLQNNNNWTAAIRNQASVRTQITLPLSLLIKKKEENVITSGQPFGGKKKKKRSKFNLLQ